MKKEHKLFSKKYLHKKTLKAKIAQVSAASLALILAATMAITKPIEVMAKTDVFDDLSDLVDYYIKYPSMNKFQIVEVCDDDEEAAIGYLIGGQEPFRKFETITNETKTNGDLDPTDSLSSLVEQLQENGIIGSTTGNDLTPKHPLYYDIIPYNGESLGSPLYNQFWTNQATGLAGRDLVHGYYVEDSGGYYVKENTSSNINLRLCSDAVAAINLDISGSTIVTIPSDGQNSAYTYTWYMKSTKPDSYKLEDGNYTDSDKVASVSYNPESPYDATITAISDGRTFVTCLVTDSSENVIARYFCIVAAGSGGERGISATLSYSDEFVIEQNQDEDDEDLCDIVSIEYGESGIVTGNVTLQGIVSDDITYSWEVDKDEVIYLYDESEIEEGTSLSEYMSDTDNHKTSISKKDLSRIGIYAFSGDGNSCKLTLTVTTSYNGIDYSDEVSCNIEIGGDGLVFDPSQIIVTSPSGDVQTDNSTQSTLSFTDALKSVINENGVEVSWSYSFVVDNADSSITDYSSYFSSIKCGDKYLTQNGDSSGTIDGSLPDNLFTDNIDFIFTVKEEIANKTTVKLTIKGEYTVPGSSSESEITAVVTAVIYPDSYIGINIDYEDDSYYEGDSASFVASLDYDADLGVYSLEGVTWEAFYKAEGDENYSSYLDISNDDSNTEVLNCNFNNAGIIKIIITGYTYTDEDGESHDVTGSESDPCKEVSVTVNKLVLSAALGDASISDDAQNPSLDGAEAYDYELTSYADGEYYIVISSQKGDISTIVITTDNGNVTQAAEISGTNYFSISLSEQLVTITYETSGNTYELTIHVTTDYEVSSSSGTRSVRSSSVVNSDDENAEEEELSEDTDESDKSDESDESNDSDQSEGSDVSDETGLSEGAISIDEPGLSEEVISTDEPGLSKGENRTEYSNLSVMTGSTYGTNHSCVTGNYNSSNLGIGILDRFWPKTLVVYAQSSDDSYASTTATTVLASSAEESGNVVMTYVVDTDLFDSYYKSYTRYKFVTTKPSTGEYIEGYGYATYTLTNNEWFKQYVFGMTDNYDIVNAYVNVIDLTTLSDDLSTRHSEILALSSQPNLIYVSADGIADDAIVAALDDIPDNSDIKDITVADAKRLIRKTITGGSTNSVKVYTSSDGSSYEEIYSGGMVNYNLYAKRDESLISSNQPNLYLMGIIMMSENRSDYDKDSGLGTMFSSSESIASSITKVTSSFNTLQERGNYALSNMFVLDYETGRFSSSYNGSSDSVHQLVNLDFNNGYTTAEYSGGFENVYQYVVEENVKRAAKSSSSMSTSFISPALVIQYILLYSDTVALIYKTSINVLELEPYYAFKYYETDTSSSDYELNKAKRAEAFAEAFAPQFATYSNDYEKLIGILNEINITGMSTAEFVGSIEDVCEEYDVIYIGTQVVKSNIITLSKTSDNEVLYYYYIEDDTDTPVANIGTGNIAYSTNTSSSEVYCPGPLDSYTYSSDFYWLGDDDMYWSCHWSDMDEGVYAAGFPARNLTNIWLNGVEYTWYYNSDAPTSSYWYRTKNFPVFNDSNLDGVIYMHTGDTIYDTYYSRTISFSGNDILQSQENQMINFLKLGYPIIVDNDFLTYTNGIIGTTPTGISSGDNVYTTPSALVSASSNEIGAVGSAASASVTSYHGTLDSSSVMYDLVNTVCDFSQDTSWSDREYMNFLTDYEARTSGIEDYLNQSKLTIELTSQPTPYTPVTYSDKASTSIDESNILNPDACEYLKKTNGFYYLEYEFSISDVANVTPLSSTYKVELYLDSNSDGRFAGSTDDGKSDVNRSDTEIIALTSANITDSNGNSADPDNLSAYTTYHITRQLPNGYSGSIAWKLKVTLNDSGSSLSSHDSIIGMTAVLPSETVKLDILQITSDFQIGGTGGNSSSGNIKDMALRDLQFQMEYVQDGYWGGMLTNVPGYELNIISITNVDFANSYKNGPDSNNGYVLKGKDIQYDEATGTYSFTDEIDFSKDDNRPDYLEGYDMVIIGFYDAFPNIPSKLAIEALTKYGENGNSMLFTHDTTSGFTDNDLSMLNADGFTSETAGSTYSTAYTYYGSPYGSFISSYLSSSIRDLTGMDRFNWTLGASTNYLVNKNASSGNYSTIHDTATVVNFASTSDAAKMGITYSSSFASSKFKTYLYGMNRKRNETTYTVDQVNDGAIASYPYEIPSTLSVSRTHSQYFQLNLDMDNDSDKDSDITVWYTLGAGSADNGATQMTNSVYGLSPYDARNNYYIYNRGSITYSGAGHSDITNTPQEIQLFINTMIAASKAGIQSPIVQILDSDLSNGIESDLIPFDANAQSYASNNSSEDLETDDTNYVYFTATDLNVTNTNHWIEYRYFLALNSNEKYDGTISADAINSGAVVMVECNTSTGNTGSTDTTSTTSTINNAYYANTYVYDSSGTWVADANAANGKIESGSYYRLKISLNDLQVTNPITGEELNFSKESNYGDSLDIYVGVRIGFTGTNGDQYTDDYFYINTDKIKLSHPTLFDID